MGNSVACLMDSGYERRELYMFYYTCSALKIPYTFFNSHQEV